MRIPQRGPDAPPQACTLIKLFCIGDACWPKIPKILDIFSSVGSQFAKSPPKLAATIRRHHHHLLLLHSL